MDIKKIKELVKILEDSALEEIELETKDSSIRLAKPKSTVMNAPMMMPQQFAMPAPAASAGGVADNADASANKEETSGEAITSPMVGTFYRSPSTDASPFVEVGDKVNAGDVLCIIEAMKTMNKFKSDKSGTIKSIAVEDGTAVEFGQNLFFLE